MKKYWVSWYHAPDAGPFELHSPWWISGSSDSGETVCAAVLAVSEDEAREVVMSAYDYRPPDVEFRFVEERPDDWTPFTDRFPRADWMRWED